MTSCVRRLGFQRKKAGSSLFKLIAIILGLMAIGLSFWSRSATFVIIGVSESLILFMLAAIKTKKWKNIPDLSDRANELLQRHGHYYAMPFASGDLSASASAMQLTNTVLAIIFGIDGQWMLVLISIANMGVMGYVAKEFNPSVFLTDIYDKVAHEEIIAYVSDPGGK